MGGSLSTPRRLVVRIEGVASPVGLLEDDLSGDGYRVRFTYVADYNGPALSASMPPRTRPYENAEARVFFDNLLPEGSQRLSVTPDGSLGARPFDEDDVVGLLSVLGGECPGAVMITPEGAPPPKVPGEMPQDYAPLTDQEVERMLRDAASGRNPEQGDRASLPGVQRKVALSYIENGDVFLRASTPGVPSTHFLKVAPANDPRFLGCIANEVLCMRVAATVGLPVADVRRISFDTIDALLVCRYDRVVADGMVRRLHQEDAAQALGLGRRLKYEKEARKASRSAGLTDLMVPFAALTQKPAETRDILRRAVFLNWLLGNNDGHMKNFSLLHPARGGRPQLAPLYDIVSVEALPGGWTDMAMRIKNIEKGLAVNGDAVKWLAALDAPSPRQPSPIAVRQRLSAFRDMAASVPGAIDTAVADDNVDEQEAEPVRKLVWSRLDILNRDLRWGLPTTPTPRKSGIDA
jgi:serine/threonine-protein kinase HipA